MKEYSWELPENEKKRILNLHESATKKHYIKEQNNPNQNVITVRYFTDKITGAKRDTIYGRYNPSTKELDVDFGEGRFYPMPDINETNVITLDQQVFDVLKDYNNYIFLRDDNYEPNILYVPSHNGKNEGWGLVKVVGPNKISRDPQALFIPMVY